jgi:hypothetical protein
LADPELAVRGIVLHGMTSFEELDFEPIAKHVFEQFLVLRPLVPVEGLFRAQRRFYIVVPGATTDNPEGAELVQWFDTELRPLAHPIELTPERPEDATEVSVRRMKEVAEGHGVVRTWYSINRDAALALPDSFPLIGIHADERTAVVQVDRPLDEGELRALESVFERLGAVVPFRVEVSTAPSLNTRPPHRLSRPDGSHDLALVPARRLRSDTPNIVSRLVAEDDECWRTEGVRYLSGKSIAPEPRSPSWGSGPSCLVSTTFPVANIRSYLTLYSTTIVVAPLAGNLEPTLSAFGVSRQDLTELSQRGHVRWLFPQAIDRYDASWMAELAEAAPNGLLLSRRLALLALRDQRARNPLYHLPATAYERRGVLRALLHFADSAPLRTGVWGALRGLVDFQGERQRLFVGTLARALSEHWAEAEYMMQLRGAMGSISGPLARHATELGKLLFGRDLFIELGAAAQNVEWAGALGAHLLPEEVGGYSAAAASGFLVALCSGGSRRAILTRRPNELTLAQDLLAFDNDTNVIDFVSDLGKGDLARIGPLIAGLANGTTEESREKLRLWNAQVRHYERRPDRLRTFGVSGIVLAAASQLSSDGNIRSIVPLMAPLMPLLMTQLNEELVRDSAVVGALQDWANGALAGAAPGAVLVSRLRKRVAGMKERK